MSDKYLRPPDAADKVDAAQRKYFRSERGKAAQKRWRDSEGGKEALKRYLRSDKGKEALKRAQLKYYNDKGRTGNALAKAYLEWLEANPNGTAEDFLKEFGK